MADSVYKVIELVGTSPRSWEAAAASAVKTASQSLRDLRIAEVVELDMHIEEGKPIAYRAKLKLSFKYSPGAASPGEAPASSTRRRGARKAAAAPEEAEAPAKKARRGGRKKK